MGYTVVCGMWGGGAGVWVGWEEKCLGASPLPSLTDCGLHPSTFTLQKVQGGAGLQSEHECRVKKGENPVIRSAVL